MSQFARHKSLDKHLRPAVAWLRALAGVTRVVIDRTCACSHRLPPGHLRLVRSEPGGLRVKAYGGGCITSLFVAVPTAQQPAVCLKLIARR
jgi:hypothetical protein